MVNEMMTKNKDALITAAQLQAGEIALNTVMKLLTPKIPVMLRGYASTPLGAIVVANMIALAVENNLHRGNKRIEQLSSMMMTSAMSQMINSFDIGAMLESFLPQMPKSVLKELEKADAAG